MADKKNADRITVDAIKDALADDARLAPSAQLDAIVAILTRHKLALLDDARDTGERELASVDRGDDRHTIELHTASTGYMVLNVYEGSSRPQVGFRFHRVDFAALVELFTR